MSRLGSRILTFSTPEEVSWLESSTVILLFKISLSRNKKMLFFGVQMEQRTEDRRLRGVQERDQRDR
jgi:hypothetical protein